MATMTRQPFAPLDGTRLQSLTSLKNRQHAIIPQTAGKRKAEYLDTNDTENIDPSLFAKRSKGLSAPKDLLKPSAFVLKATSSAASSPLSDARRLSSPVKSVRHTIQPKSPAARLSVDITKKSTSPYAPAGRSPTRGKRSGLVSSRRRAAAPYTRVDPYAYGLGSAAPFSLDAALKGTIPGYGTSKPVLKEPSTALHEPEMKASWFFDIHEDTPEQEMTNLLQHSTCTLDISSDEESQRKASRDNAEGRDKENVPPPDDISQTSSHHTRRAGTDDIAVDKERIALGEMNRADFYPEGCDESSIIMVPADDEQPQRETATATQKIEPEQELKVCQPTTEDIDKLMTKPTSGSSKAAVLAPIEGTGESFELWESASAKDEAELATGS